MKAIMNVAEWLATNWSGLLAVVFTFGFMIFVHEMGHFLMAKRVGITVHEFALGFGPRLLRFGGKKKKDGEDEDEESLMKAKDSEEPVETEYCLRAIPFGGFVRMEGEDESGDMDDPGNFNNKSPWDRFKVIVAGCTMNYITGMLLMIIVGLVWGLPGGPAENPPAKIGRLIDNYPLQKAGFEKNDTIKAVDNVPVKNPTHLINMLLPLKGKAESVTLTLEKNGQMEKKVINLNEVKLDKVETESQALTALGLAENDRIVQIDSLPVIDFMHLSAIISSMTEGDTVTLHTLRGKDNVTTSVAVFYDKDKKKGMLGFSPPPVGILNFTFVKADKPMDVVKYTVTRTAKLTAMPVIIVQMIMEKQISPKEVAEGSMGPVGISQMLFEVSKKGIPSLLFMCGLLSILIGAFNLYPLPALDGLRAVFVVIEQIRKKPLDPEKEGMVHQVGFIVLMILVLVVTFNDITRIIKGNNPF